jgi:NTE family protein
MSPYQRNPLDLNPLRDILASELDFEPVRRCHKLRLCVSATHARTGQLRKFRQSEVVGGGGDGASLSATSVSGVQD